MQAAIREVTPLSPPVREDVMRDQVTTEFAANSLVGPTVKAFGWRFLSETSIFITRFVVAVVLAHLLPVEAFGVLAVAMVVINFAAKMSYMGMSQAIIQTRNLTEKHIRVAFSLSMLSGILITAVVWATAPLLASAFRAEAAGPVLRLMSFWFLCAGISATASGLLQRQLDYRRLVRVEIGSSLFGYVLVSLTLAARGYGVWALAWAFVAEAVLKTILVLTPSPHSLKPGFSGPEARVMLRYGVGLTLSSLSNYAALNGDNFVVGRWLGTAALGLYSRAFQLMTLPLGMIVSVISNVLFPVYSMIQSDHERLRRAYLSSVSLSSIAIFPLLTGIAIAAPEIMGGVFGKAWVGATLPLQILCVGGAFHCMYNLADSLVRARGAVYLKFFYHTIYAACVLGGSLVGARWGIDGVSVGVVGSLVVIYLLLGRLSIRLIEANWRMFLLAQLPGVIMGAGLFLIAFPTTLFLRATHLPQLVILGCTLVVSLAATVATFLVLPRRWLSQVTFGALTRISEHPSVRNAIALVEQSLKTFLRGHRWAFHIALVPFRLYENSVYVRHIFRRGLWGTLLGFRRATFRRARQKEMTWSVPFPRCKHSSELIRWLRTHDVIINEGVHAFYIPPQPRLKELIPAVVRFYPAGSGFKVLKDLKPPARARYLYANRSLVFLLWLIGAPRDQIVTANFMYSKGIGSRVWDLTCWEAAGKLLTVFVVDHVTGQTPTAEQCSSFLSLLRELDSDSPLRVLLPDWEGNEDFKAPDCNNNLIYSDTLGRPLYIDFQNFSLTSPDLWLKKTTIAANCAAHTREIGAKPKTKGNGFNGNQADTQWIFVLKALHDASLSLEGRIILDIGSKSGYQLHSSLARGAAWGFGWFEPATAERASNLLFSLGLTRFSVYGASLDSAYKFQNDIPGRFHERLAESVVFYRGSRNDGGLPATVQNMPWRILVHEQDRVEMAEGADELVPQVLSGRPQILSSRQVYGNNGLRRQVTVFIRR